MKEVGEKSDRRRSFLNAKKYRKNFADIDIVLSKLLQNLKWKKILYRIFFKLPVKVRIGNKESGSKSCHLPKAINFPVSSRGLKVISIYKLFNL